MPFIAVGSTSTKRSSMTKLYRLFRGCRGRTYGRDVGSRDHVSLRPRGTRGRCRSRGLVEESGEERAGRRPVDPRHYVRDGARSGEEYSGSARMAHESGQSRGPTRHRHASEDRGRLETIDVDVSGCPEETTLARLLQDIGMNLMMVNHGWWCAQFAEPYVSEKVSWAIRYHQALRSYPALRLGTSTQRYTAVSSGKTTCLRRTSRRRTPMRGITPGTWKRA